MTIIDTETAAANLIGKLIGLAAIGMVLWAIFGFLRRLFWKHNSSASNPTSAPLSPPVSDQFVPHNPEQLNKLKEELFSLESDKLSGKISTEEYTEARTAIDVRMKLESVADIADSSPLAPVISEQNQIPKESSRFSPWITVPIFATLCCAAILLFVHYGYSAEALGYWAGTLLIPCLIAYAVAGVKRRRNWGTFTLVFLISLGFMSGVSHHQKSISNLSHSEIVREFSGMKSVDENLPESEKEMATVMRATFGEIRDFDKSENEQLKILELGMGKLYTSESFSGKDAMHRTKDAVNKAVNLDNQMAAMIERMPETVKTRLGQTNLSDDSKNNFMKGFLKSFNSPDFVSSRNTVVAAETQWANSIDDLYSYSLQHSSEIMVRKGAIGIANNVTRSTFNQKLNHSEDLRDNFLSAYKKATEVRDAAFKNYGISAADMGLEK